MTFGLTAEKLFLLGLLAVLIIGPTRLPALAAQAARVAHRVVQFVNQSKQRLRDELGEEVDFDEWRRLDPRQYDPRRIIRDALLAPPPG